MNTYTDHYDESFEAKFRLAVEKRCGKLYGNSIPKQVADCLACLLYTSDAADE